MGKRTSIYIDDDVAAAARRLELNVSEVCQRALVIAIDGAVVELNAQIAAGEAARARLAQIHAAPEADDGEEAEQ